VSVDIRPAIRPLIVFPASQAQKQKETKLDTVTSGYESLYVDIQTCAAGVPGRTPNESQARILLDWRPGMVGVAQASGLIGDLMRFFLELGPKQETHPGAVGSPGFGEMADFGVSLSPYARWTARKSRLSWAGTQSG